MSYSINTKIKAPSAQQAQEIAKAMESMSEHFTAKQWKAIAEGMKNPTVRMRVKILLT